MFHRTFNPGPSQISDEVKADIKAAADDNIVAISHRSQVFANITKQAVQGLRQYFDVPDDYHIVFTGSATEAMELVIRNLVEKESFHLTNGHFAELFARISKSHGKQADVDSVEWGQQNDFAKAQIPESAEIVTITYNETSTGTTCTNQDIRDLRKRTKDQILVVDITSVAGCLPLEIDQADVWLFSVQKGMGLPSGLGIMFISPTALKRAERLHHTGLINLLQLTEKMKEHQTIQTPNVLGIYLLAKQLERWNKIGSKSIYTATEAKAKLLDNFVKSHKQLDYFVKEPVARSKTTVCIEAKPEIVDKLRGAAKQADLVLGSGYGKIKPNTFRVANFPTYTEEDFRLLISTLEKAL